MAIDWLQKSIDELAEATRRTSELRSSEGPPPDSASVAATDSAAERSSSGPGTRLQASETPLLDRVGRDLTKLAAEGQLPPIIGREEELGWLIETLVRTTKRNPVLLGAAGAGKTAIVEGFAQLVAAGSVPAPLRGIRLIEVPLAGLVAGTEYRGQMEQRLQQLVAEASRPGIVLFFDEIHLLEGAGRSEGGMGADEVLKPALARGEIAVIGATTPEEYRATIERDTALARRFTPIAIHELDKAATRPILRAVRDRLAKARGVRVSDAALDVLLDFADTSVVNRRFPDKALDLLEQAVARAIVAGRTRVDRDDAVRTTVQWSERASSTPTLERFGRDLVALARDGKLGPIVGREREIEAIVQVLLRRSKRNPLLLGPAGSGKTAIVEGLAIRIVSGQVPAALRIVRLFDIQLLPLAQAVAREPSTLTDLLLEARHPSVVVFFDEVHQLASPTIESIGEALKPALARGEIACVGATTGEEYQAYLEPEAALARRFSLISVQPMDEAAVRNVLRAVRDSLQRLRGVQVSDEALDELVALADQLMPNRFFPDKGVDVIEQTVAYAVSHGLSEVNRDVARTAIAELVGMSLDPSESLVKLGRELGGRELLEPAASEALVSRLGVTLRALDSHAQRPDAVVLLAGPAATIAEELARLLAGTIFGRETAVITVDLGGMADDYSISSLLGSAPGLVGSERPLPLHELRRAPWQVVVFRGIDRCAPSIREVVAAGLGDGQLTDAMGRRIPLGSTIVILTAPTVAIGGPTSQAGLAVGGVLEALLGPGIAKACDVVAGLASGSEGSGRAEWIERELLAPLLARFARQDIGVTFEPGFVEWLAARLLQDGGAPDAFLDTQVTPMLLAELPPGAHEVVARIVEGAPVLAPANATDDGQALG